MSSGGRTGTLVGQLAVQFLLEYVDPEIGKRLFFDVWADRLGLETGLKSAVWRKVVHLTRSRAASAQRGAQHQLESNRHLPEPNPKTLDAKGESTHP